MTDIEQKEEQEQWIGVNWGNWAPGDLGWQDLDRIDKVCERRERWRSSVLVECKVAAGIFLEFFHNRGEAPLLTKEVLLEILHTFGLDKLVRESIKSYGEALIAPCFAKIQADPAVIAAKAAIGPEPPTKDDYRRAGAIATDLAYSMRAQGFSDTACCKAAKQAFEANL